MHILFATFHLSEDGVCLVDGHLDTLRRCLPKSGTIIERMGKQILKEKFISERGGRDYGNGIDIALIMLCSQHLNDVSENVVSEGSSSIEGRKPAPTNKMETITKAIILSGGIELPLISEFKDYHRALLPVANTPLLYYSISNLARHGVREIFITCDSKKESIFRELLSPLEHQVRLTYIPEPFPRGTAGTLLHITNYVSGEPFWVLQGGLITDLDFSKIAKLHKEQKRAVTIVSRRSDFPLEGICMDQSGYVEKIYLFHKSRDRRKTYTPCGVYLFNPKVLDHIDSRGYYDLKEQLIPRLHEEGLSIQIYEINGEGYVKEVRTLSDYYEANWNVVDRDMASNVNGNKREWGDRIWVEEGTSIAPDVQMIGPLIIGKGVRIGANCKIVGPAVIGDNTIIKENSIFRESITLEGSLIPNGGRVEYTLWSQRGEAYRFKTKSFPQNGNRNGTFKGRNPSPNKKWAVYSFLKRFTDIFLSILCLIVLFPVFFLVAVAIRLDSPGPIFYTQRRCGLNGREFSMVKFRTMVKDADKCQAELFKHKDVDGPVFKMNSDPRVTRLGDFLRRTSLDETPQLWNVIKGEMSFIGPRPLIMDEMKCNPLWRDVRLTVKPGITGLWQINGRGATSFHEWIQNDITYVLNQRLLLDMKILLATITKTLWRVGAH